MDLYGKVDDDLAWEWFPLYEPSGKELAEIRKSDADRDAVYLDKNVVAADEVRDKLRDDPESGYTNLEGDAPEPPSIPGFDPETGAPLPEVGSENKDDDKPPKAGNDE